MRFPAAFYRYIGALPAGGKALGSDTVPAAGSPPNSTADNVLPCRFQNINGWPIQRIAVCYNGPVGASNLTARMYFYEDQTQAWYQVGPQVTMVPGTVSFFDVVALLEMPNTLQNLANAAPGSAEQLLIVDSVGAAAGKYSFAMGPDLTSQA